MPLEPLKVRAHDKAGRSGRDVGSLGSLGRCGFKEVHIIGVPCQ